MTEDTIAELTRQLEEARREAAHYRRLSAEGGDRRLRESEELSRLVAQLRQTEEELEKARNELEQRVQEHTAELRKSNKRLLKEVAERDKIEQALRRANELLGNSEERYRLLLENVEFPVLVVALTDARVLYINERAAVFFGTTVREAVGAYAPEYWVYPETRERFIADLVKHGRVSAFEALLWTRTGDQRWVLLSANLIDYIDKQASFIVFSDITERKQAEEALRESEDKYRRLHESMRDGFGSTDLNGRILDVNHIYHEMLGYSKEELLGLSYQEVTPERWHKYEADIVEHQVLVRGYSDVYEKELRRRDGSLVPVELRTYLMRDQTGQPIGYWATVRDISERKRAEEERLQLERRLLDAQKIESLGLMAGGIAHDFNNLLSVILGNLELALLRLPQAASARSRVDQALQASCRASHLIHQMLAYSGKGRFLIARMDLNELVRENADLFRAVVAKATTLSLHLTVEPSIIEADSGQVRQVIMNLITNASEATEEVPGTVTLTTGVKVCDEAYLRRSCLDEKPPGGRFVYVEVADTGCGMDEQAQQRLFDPFFTTKFIGRGLGMSAVLGIVKGHKGAIIVESAAGLGTTIRVLFRACREESGTADKVPQESLLPPYQFL